MRLDQLGEDQLIKRAASLLHRDESVVCWIGDDCAAFPPPGKGRLVLLACDTIVEGIHFDRAFASGSQIGWKALAVNLSDIAAMGGIPRYAICSLGIGPGENMDLWDEIFQGMESLAGRCSVSIVGGDTVKSSAGVSITVSVVGEVEKERMVTRDGASAGEDILVTGVLGGSGKGHHLDFQPRIDEARALTARWRLGAMIDISDGLVLDLGRILSASGCGAELKDTAIPVRWGSALESALIEGEDFELLFTVNPGDTPGIISGMKSEFDLAISCIGRVTDRKGTISWSGEDEALPKLDELSGYDHFRGK